METNLEKKIFKPRSSTGWVWVAIIALLLLATGISLIVSSGLGGPLIIMILITILIGIGSLLLAIFFPTMRYEMNGSLLKLTYGPLLRYTINIREIKSIR